MFFIKSADAQDVLYLALHIIHAALPVMADGCMADFLHSLGKTGLFDCHNHQVYRFGRLNSSAPSYLSSMAVITLFTNLYGLAVDAMTVFVSSPLSFL